MMNLLTSIARTLSNNKNSSKSNTEKKPQATPLDNTQPMTSTMTLTMAPISATQTLRTDFWRKYPLHELNHDEWEALCDGCGGCCLEKFLEPQDDPSMVEYTDVACKLLDCQSGYCSDYTSRKQYVPECVTLTADKISSMMWLPSNCAYKRLFLGQGLPKWHLLITKDSTKTRKGMQDAGVGVAGRCISETLVNEWDLEDHIVRWVQA